MEKVMSELAFEYFKIGNAVTAFYVVQTLLFLNAIYKEPKLLSALCSNRKLASKATWIIAFVYIFIVVFCASAELFYRYNSIQPPQGLPTIVLIIFLFPAAIKSIIIVILAWACSTLIKKYLKVEETAFNDEGKPAQKMPNNMIKRNTKKPNEKG